MRSFVDLDKTFGNQPPGLGAALARIDTGRGQERLFADQMSELLKQLSESARVASITASNAIENIVLDDERAEIIAGGSPRFRNRNEREFAGYRDAVDSLVRLESYEPLSVPLLLHLHRLLFHHVDGRGGYLKIEQNYIVSYEDGRREILFTPPDGKQTEALLPDLLDRYNEAKAKARAHPLVLLGALVVDLLAIHPVADGNGRLARLVTTHELLAQGYGVARYVSIEHRIFESKNSYYAGLYASQQGWHDGEHNIWPWTSYLVTILDDAYEAFERRVGEGQGAGSKQERVRRYILEQAPQHFRTRDIQRALPGISPGTIRLVLSELKRSQAVVSEGSGPGARWHRPPA
jgi:Fic family protein